MIHTFLIRTIVLCICTCAVPGWSQTVRDSIVFLRAFGNGEITSTAYTADSKQVLLGTYDGKVRLYDQETGNLVLTYAATWPYPKIVRSPSGNSVAIYDVGAPYSVSIPKSVSIFEMKTGKLLKEIAIAMSNRIVSFSANDSALLIANIYGSGFRYSLYNANDSAKHFNLRCNPILSLDGTYAISFPQYSSDSIFCSGLTRTFGWARKFPSFTSPEFFQDSFITILPKSQNGLLVINAATGDTVRRIAKSVTLGAYYTPPLQALRDNRIVFGMHDTICVWDAKADTLVTRLKGKFANRSIHGFSPDGAQIIIEDPKSNTFLFWSASSGDSLGVYAPYALSCFSFACRNPQLSADGTKILSEASVNNGTRVTIIPRLWDASTGSVLHTFWQFPSLIHPRLSSDGTRMLTATDLDTLILWDVETGNVIRTFHSGLAPAYTTKAWYSGMSAEFEDHDSTIFSTFSIDDFLTTVSNRHSTRGIWWNVNTGKIIKQMKPVTNSEEFCRVFSSADHAKYLLTYRLPGSEYPEVVNIFNASNDSLLGGPSFQSRLINTSSDLSNTLFSNGYRWGYPGNETSIWFNTVDKTTCQGACFSRDNSKILCSFVDGYASRWWISLHTGNKDYAITSHYPIDAADVDNNDFSTDGTRLLVNFLQGQPCLYDISSFSSAITPVVATIHYSGIKLHASSHRKIRLSVPPNSISCKEGAELRIYSPSGRLLTRFPIPVSLQTKPQWYTLPSTFSTGIYVYRIENAFERSSGLFSVKP
jgi:hypothetical protein